MNRQLDTRYAVVAGLSLQQSRTVLGYDIFASAKQLFCSIFRLMTATNSNRSVRDNRTVTGRINSLQELIPSNALTALKHHYLLKISVCTRREDLSVGR